MLSFSTLTFYAYLAHSFRVRRLLAAGAFFIFLSGAAQAQTYFSGTPQTIDTGINNAVVGQHTSLEIVNGNPAISYYDATNGDLKYIRAANPSGTSWEMSIPVDTGGIANDNVGQYTSLEVVNGYPAISYYDVTNTNLKYVRAKDMFGISWEDPITIDSSGNVGAFTSLAVVDLNPAISYQDINKHDLKYVRANGPDGTTGPDPWGTPFIVDGFIQVGDDTYDLNTGYYTSLVVVHGNPAIAYYQTRSYPNNSQDTSVRYVRALTPRGATRADWGAPVTVSNSGSDGKYPSLAVVNGRPAISYFSSGKSLRYTRAHDDDGGSWGTNVNVDDSHGVQSGYYTSLVVVNGKPAISYHEQTNHYLKYARANDADGTSWGAGFRLDPPVNVTDNAGSFTSLAVVNCNPAISYFASTGGNLKYFRSIPVWSGADLTSDPHWDVDANWGHGCVPEPGDSVLLPRTGVKREAVIHKDDVIVTDLTMEAKRTLRISGGGTLRVNGVLTMGGRNITVDPGSKIIFGCNASIVRSPLATAFIIGDARKEFCSAGVFTFPVGEITGTAEYSPMTANVTAGTFPLDDPPSLTVRVTDTWLPALIQSNAVSRYWPISSEGDLMANLTFQYLTSDVNGAEASYKVFRRAGVTITVPSDPPDTASNTITATNVSNFPEGWGLGTLAEPQCVAIGGQAVRPDASPPYNGVKGALVTLVEQNGTIQTANTNPFGRFAFKCVDVGQTVMVSVTHPHYQFTPQSLFITVKTEALIFTAQ